MPTTKKNNSKKVISKKPVKVSFVNKLKALASPAKSPLLALVIVLSICALGYYGYLRSSADSFSNTPPSVTCGAKLSNKECKQKQAESDVSFYARLQKACDGSNRSFKANTCGECRASFVEQNGSCKPVPPVDCNAQHRKDADGKTCGGCKTAFEEKGGACVERAKVDCSTQHRKQSDGYSCGGCKEDWSEYGGSCIQKGTDDTKAQKACADQYRTYVKSSKSCGDCVSGYWLNGTACAKQAKGDPTVVKQACKDQLFQYDQVGNVCDTTHCIAGYYMSATKACTAVSTTPSSVVKANCARDFRQYDPNSNGCGNCLTNYFTARGTTCTYISPALQQKTITACKQAHLAYDVQANKCAVVCMAGFGKNTAGKCVIAENAQKMQEFCKALHLQYDSALVKCSTNCEIGYAFGANKLCTTPSAIKTACGEQHLRFDTRENKCKETCVADYAKKLNGKCVKEAEIQTGMTEGLCHALGRVWMPAVSSPVIDRPVISAAYCSTNCRQAGVTNYVATDVDLTSYCKPNEGTTSVNTGVALDLTEQQCADLHRIYLTAVKGCSARCVTAWYHDDGICKDVLFRSDQVLDTGGTSDGGDGGCTEPLQPVLPIRKTADLLNSSQVVVNYVCPDDDTNPGPQTPGAGLPVKHDVDRTIKHDECTLLGREWVADAKDDNGKKVKGGCSTQACNFKGAEVRNSNGSGYCEGSAIRISKDKCNDLHRVWIADVKACATKPNQNRVKPLVNAPQCEPPYTVYVYHSEKQGHDECLKPSAYEYVKGVAKSSGKPVAYVASLPAQGVCKLRPTMAWSNGKCVRKRIASDGATVAPPASDGQDGPAQNANGSGVTAVFCRAQLHRPYDGKGGCVRACLPGYSGMTNYQGNQWDKCLKTTSSTSGGEQGDNSSSSYWDDQHAGSSPAPSSNDDDHHQNQNTTSYAHPLVVSCSVMHTHSSKYYCLATNPHTQETYCPGGHKITFVEPSINGTFYKSNNLCVKD